MAGRDNVLEETLTRRSESGVRWGGDGQRCRAVTHGVWETAREGARNGTEGINYGSVFGSIQRVLVTKKWDDTVLVQGEGVRVGNMGGVRAEVG